MMPNSMLRGVTAYSCAPRASDILDRRIGVEGSEHVNLRDGGARKLRRDVQGDSGKAEHMNLQHLSGSGCRFEVFTVEVPQTQVETFSDGRPLDHVGVAVELIADRGSNEIRPVRVETLRTMRST